MKVKMAGQLRRFHWNLSPSPIAPFLSMNLTRCQYLLIWPVHINTFLCHDQKPNEETWPFSLSFRCTLMVIVIVIYFIFFFIYFFRWHFWVFAHPRKPVSCKLQVAGCWLASKSKLLLSGLKLASSWQTFFYCLSSFSAYCLLLSSGFFSVRAKTRSGHDQTQARQLKCLDCFGFADASACNFLNAIVHHILIPFLPHLLKKGGQ